MSIQARQVTTTGRPQVAVVHDYLTQRGGAERVVLSMLKAFDGAALHTSLYHPSGTFPAYSEVDVRVQVLNRVGLLRRHHRLALPVLAPAFSSRTVDAELALCSSSGWAHGIRSTGRKVVYCYSPARWLYQQDRYLNRGPSIQNAAARALRAPLKHWDRRAAGTADRYIAISRMVRDQIWTLYGHDAEVLGAPVTIDVGGSRTPVAGLDPGYFLCVSRLLPYKNVGAVVEAFGALPHLRLVVVGSGPLAATLRAGASPNVTLTGSVPDSELRWLYANCEGFVAASFEDYGLTPLEGAAFGKPTAALRWGGFLDTVVEGSTGHFFDEPTAAQVAGAVLALRSGHWRAETLRAHAAGFNEERFIARLRAIIAEELDS